MASDEEFQNLVDDILLHSPEALWLCGDIAVAGNLEDKLKQLQSAIQIPIYFVLGNHDYYNGSINQVRHDVKQFTADNDYLFWLPESGPIQLSSDTSLIGHGGWGDARFGDFDESTVYMNDYVTIKELSQIQQAERKTRLQALGDEAAESIQSQLELALKTSDTVYILTHVPPFQAAAWHEGHPSDDNFAPHFSCKATGETIVKIMSQSPDKKAIVLCGHTHGRGKYLPIDNVTVITCPAEYRYPRIGGVVKL